MKIRTVEFVGSFVNPRGPLPEDLPAVAFSGRSNVGKSSLINTLLGRTRKKSARVSATPGKTQELNFYRVNGRFYLVDLPGFGYARVPYPVRESWKALVDGYLVRNADRPLAVVHLIDARRDPRIGDLRMLSRLAELAIPVLVAMTKVDKLTRQDRRRRLARLVRELDLDEEHILPCSSTTREGKEELLGAMQELLDATEMTVPQSAVRDGLV